jgi:molybdopterin converting factor small subunit
MVVEVRLFASLAERAGWSSRMVEIDPGMIVEDLWRLLQQRHAGLTTLTYRPLAACDRVYAAWDRGLQGVHEVAFMPPLSGGCTGPRP